METSAMKVDRLDLLDQPFGSGLLFLLVDGSFMSSLVSFLSFSLLGFTWLLLNRLLFVLLRRHLFKMC